jgi:hypothetical protein
MVTEVVEDRGRKSEQASFNDIAKRALTQKGGVDDKPWCWEVIVLMVRNWSRFLLHRLGHARILQDVGTEDDWSWIGEWGNDIAYGASREKRMRCKRSEQRMIRATTIIDCEELVGGGKKKKGKRLQHCKKKKKNGKRSQRCLEKKRKEKSGDC